MTIVAAVTDRGGGHSSSPNRCVVDQQQAKRDREEIEEAVIAGKRDYRLKKNHKSSGNEPETPLDYYDLLEVSDKATPDTIHRVYRILAQRYHPDHPETGDEKVFKDLLAAYRVLSDPEQRAAYDVQRHVRNGRRWVIFDSAEAARGPHPGAESWRCTRCGEEVDAGFAECWNCGAER